MKEKFSQKSIDNFCFLALILPMLLLGCAAAAAFVSVSKSTNSSEDELLLNCEKYGVYSNEKFEELKWKYLLSACHCKDENPNCAFFCPTDISDLYVEQQKLRHICFNSSIEELPLKMELYFKEKEIAKIKNEFMEAINYLKKEIQSKNKLMGVNKVWRNEEENKLKNLKYAFIQTSENIEKRSFQLFGIPFDPFQRCLKNYNNLVERFAEIYNLEIE